MALHAPAEVRVKGPFSFTKKSFAIASEQLEGCNATITAHSAALPR